MRLHPLATLFAALVLSALVGAQSTSGRHFLRGSRLPATPNASSVVEASSGARATAPLPKLRSGRPWPRHHFTRTPVAPAKTVDSRPTDASAGKAKTGRRGFWQPRR